MTVFGHQRDLMNAWADLGISIQGFNQALGKTTRYDSLGMLQGYDFDFVIMDEVSSIGRNAAAIKPLVRFNNPAYPECEVVVEERKGDKNDPRNPNPAAGPRRFWVVIASGRASAPIGNSVVAEAKAKTLHEKLVEAAAAAKHAHIPNWGKF